MSFTRQWLESQDWAILEEYLELMAAIESRDIENRDAVVQAIQTRFGEHVPGTRETRKRGSTAVVPVTGPLFRFADFFTDVSGATTFERLSTDLGRVMDDDDVESVILDVNSPGGTVDGMSETAAIIRSFRGTKPITAFISHLGASAAFALAAATDRIAASDMALVGSIGAVLSVTDRREIDKKRGVRRLEIVSSQTPLKRIDPFSDDDEERAQARSVLQRRVDSLAKVFIETVAQDRGQDPDDIASLGGATFVGSEALDVGLVDEIGTLESLIQKSTAGSSGRSSVSFAATGGHLPEVDMEKGQGKAAPITRAHLEANHPEIVSAIRTEGHEAGKKEGLEQGRTEGSSSERERILGIMAIEAKGHEDLKFELMADPECTKGDAALKILEARGQEEARRKQVVKDGLEADEEAVGELVTTLAGEVDDEDAEAEAAVADILGHAQKWAATGHAE